MEIGDPLESSSIGMLVEEEHENDDLLVAMDGKSLDTDDDTIYIMERIYSENEDDDNRHYIVEDSELEPQEEDEGDELYNCNACGMNFASIDDHLERYHSNQDVILDVADTTDPLSSSNVKCEPPEYINDVCDEEDAEELDEDVDDDVDDANEQLVFADMGADAGNQVARKQTGVQPKETYVCNRCSQKFGTLRSLSSHILTVHGTKSQPARTGTTPKQIVRKSVRKAKDKTTREKASEDSESDANDRPTGAHTCEQCNTVFQSAKSLKLHVRMHNPIKTKTLEEAAEHELETIANEADDVQEKFYCNICEKLYLKAFEEMHVQMHNGEEKFNCKICNKLFPNEASINMHMSAHQNSRIIRTKAEMNNVKLPYACQYCRKEFARPHEKVKHERVHTGEKPYECEICGKCFRVSYCLTIHMRTHTDARPYVCPHCNKRFKAHSVYNHHLLTHSDERNYKCPYCPKTFKTSVQLSGHKNSHTKPFSCTECNRPFGSLYAVRSHMESHKRPNHNLKYCCDICGAKYARRFALNDHMKEQHKEVQLVDVSVNQVSSTKKATQRRARPTRTNPSHRAQILTDDEFALYNETEMASDSILPDVVEQEITISEIDHFETEEEVVGIDWLK